MDKYPKVGVGVLVIKNRQFLVGKRHGSHGAGTWAPPGGHIEWMETAQHASIREVKEETGLTVTNPRVIGITNDFFSVEEKHYVTVYMSTDYVSGEPQILEPDKFSQLKWVDMSCIPQPMFLTWENLIKSSALEFLIEELTPRDV